MSITLKTAKEVEALRRSNLIVVRILKELTEYARPGVSTMDLEIRARRLLEKEPNARPAFLGYRGYPAVLCASLNEEVVHGIPSEKRLLKDGDILSLDFGVEHDGYFGDAALTVPIGKVSEEKQRLLAATRECLAQAVAAVVPGNHLSDIARAVQGHAELSGFSVVYQFVGHGIGKKMHEDPQIPNCGTPRPNVKLVPGMVLAIEPMINAGRPDVEVLEDGWTAVTVDRRPSAHFEKSVAVTAGGADVLSDW